MRNSSNLSKTIGLLFSSSPEPGRKSCAFSSKVFFPSMSQNNSFKEFKELPFSVSLAVFKAASCSLHRSLFTNSSFPPATVAWQITHNPLCCCYFKDQVSHENISTHAKFDCFFLNLRYHAGRARTYRCML